MRRIRKIVPVIIALSLLLAGCGGGMDYMIEEYNSRFGIHDDRYRLLGDLGYDENDMLEPEYHVDSTHTLNIPAPQVKGASYQWDLYKDGKVVQADHDGSHHTFQLYLPGNLGVGTYQLRLTVTVDGKEYRDTALVTVHTEIVERALSA